MLSPERQEDAAGPPPMGPITREEHEAEEWRKRAEEIFKGIPPPPIQPLPKEHAFDLSKYTNKLACTPAEAWQKCADILETYDANSCKAYREEIDTLLVFAGLFSAVLTAFIIESYQWLQDDPNDVIIALLSQLAHPGNGTQIPAAAAGLPDAVTARINAYWFLSLTLSLTAALVAILCKQWVREFERRGDQSPEVYIGVRQTKLEGFEGWGVASIVAAVPLLLQSALGLFALGLIELLWELHRTVALVVLIPTVAALLFYAATTLLPGLQIICSPFGTLRGLSQCPFKSPQAFLALRLQALLWEFFWSLSFGFCFNVAYTLFEFSYRKCLVFCRRVNAVIQPEYLPDSQNDGSRGTAQMGDAVHGRLHYLWRCCQSLWARVLRPWQCNEEKFYINIYDRPTWSRFVRWCRARLLFLPRGRRAQSPTLSSGTSILLPMEKILLRALSIRPTFRRSWITLDRQFTAFRDGEWYSIIVPDVVPVQSCFRGLAWLLTQTDHPGLPQWVWLSIWDIATNPNYWHTVRRAGLRAGILHLMGDPLYPTLISGPSSPCALALEYALRANVDLRLRGELFVRLLPSLSIKLARELWYYIACEFSPDDDIWRSGLYGILARSLAVGSVEPEHFGDLPLYPSPPLGRLPGCLSQSELACMIALKFSEQRSYSNDIFDDIWYSDLLAEMTLRYLSSLRGNQEQPSGVQSTFSALALAADRFLGKLDLPHKFDWADTVHRLSVLSDQACRRVYLDLLSDQAGVLTGGIAGAEDRLARHLRRLRNYDDSQQTEDNGGGNGRDADVILGRYPTGDGTGVDLGDAAHVLGAAQAGPSIPRIANEGAHQSPTGPLADVPDI